MKKSLLWSAILILGLTTGYTAAEEKTASQMNPTEENTGSVQHKDTKIQVALLLDTSSSMDGLIDQARARLWNIINTLTTLRFQGKAPRIEIALYEYGNLNIHTDDWIRLVTPLTSDLDLLSEKLFSLTTWGGDEYCGAVIDKAVRMLDWTTGSDDMRLIYIAGNEPFTQGTIHYKDAIDKALEKEIYVHTIHCGHAESGIHGEWLAAARYGKGQFFNIDHNARVIHIDTPYDRAIGEYNRLLNETYVGYGRQGAEKKAVQAVQDELAMEISVSNLAERAVSKSSSVYVNSEWDLVDRFRQNERVLEEVSQDELPDELKGKTQAQVAAVLKEKEMQRAVLQKKITELGRQRQAYIDEQLKEATTGDDLGEAIAQSVRELAQQKGYTIEIN